MGARVSLGFPCKVILLFTPGGPIVSTVGHTLGVRRKKATPSNVQIWCCDPMVVFGKEVRVEMAGTTTHRITSRWEERGATFSSF